MNKPIMWRELDDLRAQLHAEREAQAYERQVIRAETQDNEEDRLERVLRYQRANSHLTFGEAAEELGEVFCVGPTRYCNGKSGPEAGERQDYDRAVKSDLDPEGLRQLMVELECSAEEAEECWSIYMSLIRSGKPAASAYCEAVARTFAPSREQETYLPGPHDSAPNITITHRGQTGGVDGSFIRGINPWSASASDSDFGTQKPGDTRTFKAPKGDPQAPAMRPRGGPLPVPAPVGGR